MGWWYAMAGGASITVAWQPHGAGCCGCRIEGMMRNRMSKQRSARCGAVHRWRVSSSGMDDHLRAPIGLWVLALIICGSSGWRY